MRTYIFTEKEREILETYLKEGKKLNGFSVLQHRLKKAKKLFKDIEIALKLKKEVESGESRVF